jgi:hypothetical protein
MDGDSEDDDRKKLRRNDHPDTSFESAETVQSKRFELLAYQIHLDFGIAGCRLDQLRTEFEKRAPRNTQFVNRRTTLHQAGLLLDTGYRVRSETSKKMQAVYVATCLLTPEQIEWIKTQPLAHGNVYPQEQG